MTNEVEDLARRWLVNARRGRDHYDNLDIDLDDEVLELMVSDLDPELVETDQDIRIIANGSA